MANNITNLARFDPSALVEVFYQRFFTISQTALGALYNYTAAILYAGTWTQAALLCCYPIVAVSAAFIAYRILQIAYNKYTENGLSQDRFNPATLPTYGSTMGPPIPMCPRNPNVALGWTESPRGYELLFDLFRGIYPDALGYDVHEERIRFFSRDVLKNLRDNLPLFQYIILEMEKLSRDARLEIAQIMGRNAPLEAKRTLVQNYLAQEASGIQFLFSEMVENAQGCPNRRAQALEELFGKLGARADQGEGVPPTLPQRVEWFIGRFKYRLLRSLYLRNLNNVLHMPETLNRLTREVREAGIAMPGFVGTTNAFFATSLNRERFKRAYSPEAVVQALLRGMNDIDNRDGRDSLQCTREDLDGYFFDRDLFREDILPPGHFFAVNAWSRFCRVLKDENARYTRFAAEYLATSLGILQGPIETTPISFYDEMNMIWVTPVPVQEEAP